MNIKPYLDSTYLKTANQAGLSEAESKIVVEQYINEAVDEHFKLIMIRPNRVTLARKIIDSKKSKLLIGTVIDFPKGTASCQEKIEEAKKAIENGVDELDFVCNYDAFKKGKVKLVKEEILQCTQFGLENKKVVKWIIEVAALNAQQIIKISTLIKNCIISNFKEEDYSHVFVKSSTGFYQTKNDLPNGATIPTIIMMLENASPLPIKAAGGVRSYEDAVEMINLGVKRIGTSSAKAIASGNTSTEKY